MARAPERWSVFLDRDGVLNQKAADGDYIKGPAEFVWLPGVLEALRQIHEAGAYLFVVTNQQGVGKGIMSERQVKKIHRLLTADAAKAGAPLDGIYVCPHLAGTCDCRKPLVGLFHNAQRDFPVVDFSRSVVAGDSSSDIEAGRRLGARTVFIQREGELPVRNADAVANSLPDAVDRWILKWI
jgi:D-glycero-D-manno-heptose 1,7-bisphosphate phosphatase